MTLFSFPLFLDDRAQLICVWLWQNILGEYTNVLTLSRLPSLTVTKCLNPAICKTVKRHILRSNDINENIDRILPRLMDDLERSFDIEIPKCEGML